MLNAPEAASSENGGLGAFGKLKSSLGRLIGSEAKSAGGEGPGEALEERSHGDGAEDGDDE